jgi:hypothetical protein
MKERKERKSELRETNSLVIKAVDKKNKYLTSSVRSSVVQDKERPRTLVIVAENAPQFESVNV